MLHSTIDFDRPYEDIVETKNHWVMEQWLHYTETFSVVVLQDYKSKTGVVSILHDLRVSETWTALRAVVMHVLLPMAENALAAIDKVREQLRRYSCWVEEVFGPSRCNWNLHMVNCR